MIRKIQSLGKYLDQPLLVGKFQKAVPAVFTVGAGLHTLHEVKHAPEGQKKSTAIKTASVWKATIASALIAPRISAKIVGKEYEKFIVKDIQKRNTKLVDEFVKKQNLTEKTKEILEKSKTKFLKYKEIRVINDELKQTKSGKEFFNKLIPEPENITSKDIKNEIGRLSIMGFIPVAGGVTGGIIGDKLADKKVSKEKMADRIKEGSYQYLANIFLCNVGAGLALAGMEKMNVKSKSARAIGMIGGIVATGIIGGSAIANYIGRKVINPIFDGKNKECKKEEPKFERKPEILDVCLHTDDIATVAVMSGLKWIEPALPILYGISGYRAGIGYRNNKEPQCKKCDKLA